MSFTVTAAELQITKDRIAAVNKRAAKAGIAAQVTLNVLDRRTVTERTEFGFERTYEVIEAELQGVSDLRFGGWKLVASIDHAETGNVVNKVPGLDLEVPAEYRTSAASRCDHCQATRNRNQTILVWSEAEGFKQVGSDCVKLFLGVSPASLIGWMTELAGVEDEDGFWGRREYSVTEFVAAAALVTETYGFRPSYFDGATTKSTAFDLISLSGQAFAAFRKDFPELFAQSKAADRANTLMHECMEWIASVDPKGNEYLLNLKAAAAREVLGRNAGLLASLPNAYKKAMQQVAERAAKAQVPASVYVGTVGEKITVNNAKVVYTNRSEGYSYYGPESLFIILVDAEGHVFHLSTTVATAVADVLENADREQLFTVTGTVKKHKKDSKGTEVTVLTRTKAQEAK